MCMQYLYILKSKQDLMISHVLWEKNSKSALCLNFLLLPFLT